MNRALVFLIALVSCRVSQAVDPNDIPSFAASNALYQAAAKTDFDQDGDTDGTDWLKWQRNVGASPAAGLQSLGDSNYDFSVNVYDHQLWKARFGTPLSLIPDAVCFKLFLDPKGVVDGQVTAFLEVDNSGLGDRLRESFVATHPQYNAVIVGTTITPLPGRQLYEFRIQFQAIDPLNPPDGPVDILSLEIVDAKPELGIADTDLGFKFDAGDFVTVFDTGPPAQSTTFGDTLLDDVDLTLAVPLVLDVNTVTGAVGMRNLFGAPLEINYYEITSASGALNFNGWNSFDDQDGNPPGGGWMQLGGQGAGVLTEINFSSSLVLEIGQSANLGNAFSPTGMRDLQFVFGAPGQETVTGVVNYLNGVPAVAVPEAGTLTLAFLALAAAAARRRLTAHRLASFTASERVSAYIPSRRRS